MLVSGTEALQMKAVRGHWDEHPPLPVHSHPPHVSPGHHVVQVMSIRKHLRYPHVEACHVGGPKAEGDHQEKKEEEATTPPLNGCFRK